MSEKMKSPLFFNGQYNIFTTDVIHPQLAVSIIEPARCSKGGQHMEYISLRVSCPSWVFAVASGVMDTKKRRLSDQQCGQSLG